MSVMIGLSCVCFQSNRLVLTVSLLQRVSSINIRRMYYAEYTCPVGTQYGVNVEATLIQRHDVEWTLVLRCASAETVSGALLLV